MQRTSELTVPGFDECTPVTNAGLFNALKADMSENVLLAAFELILKLRTKAESWSNDKVTDVLGSEGFETQQGTGAD